MNAKAQAKPQAKTPAAPTAARIAQPPVAVSEREADRPDIATQLEGAARLGHSLGAISVLSASPSQIQAEPLIQRQQIPEEEREELQMKREPAAIQRQELPEEEEEEELWMKPETAALQRQELEEELIVQPDIPRVGLHGGPVARDVEAAIQRATGGGVSEVRHENRTGLPENLKAGLEHLSGMTMDDVQVHYNSAKPARLQALAYTQGTEIHVGRGQERHLPHEAWHVVQQKQGRVKPTMQMKGGVNVNDDTDLEKEAYVLGSKALQMKSDNESTFQIVDNRPEAIAQRKLLKIANNSLQVKQLKAFQEVANNHSACQAIQKKEIPVIQRITEEDAVQANFRFSRGATEHGYNAGQLQTIMQHRFHEITEGNRQSMLIGQGTEKGYGVFGQILYNCHMNEDGIYDIFVFHAHGQGRMG